MNDEYVKICPKCKSTDVGVDQTNKLQFAHGWPFLYVCNHCGYSNYVFPEINSSVLNEFEIEAKKEGFIDNTKKIDLRYSTLESRTMYKVITPIQLLLGVFFLFTDEPIGALSVFLSSAFFFYMAYFREDEFDKLKS